MGECAGIIARVRIMRIIAWVRIMRIIARVRIMRIIARVRMDGGRVCTCMRMCCRMLACPHARVSCPAASRCAPLTNCLSCVSCRTAGPERRDLHGAADQEVGQGALHAQAVLTHWSQYTRPVSRLNPGRKQRLLHGDASCLGRDEGYFHNHPRRAHVREWV